MYSSQSPTHQGGEEIFIHQHRKGGEEVAVFMLVQVLCYGCVAGRLHEQEGEGRRENGQPLNLGHGGPGEVSRPRTNLLQRCPG